MKKLLISISITAIVLIGSFLLPEHVFAYSLSPYNASVCDLPSHTGCVTPIWYSGASTYGSIYWTIPNSITTGWGMYVGGLVIQSSEYVYTVGQVNISTNYIRDVAGVYSGDNGTQTDTFTDSDGKTIKVIKYTLNQNITDGFTVDGNVPTAGDRLYAIIVTSSSSLVFADEPDFYSYMASSSSGFTATSTGSGAILGTCSIVDLACLVSNVTQYVFIPTTTSINQFSQLASTTKARFPFSYFSSMSSVWSGLSASTTLNSPSYVFNMASISPASTTPLGAIVPNFTGFSSSTVMTYFPQSLFDTLKTLAGIAILLTFFSDLFFTTRALFK